MYSQPPKLDESFIKALGLLAIHYSYLEQRLISFLCALINPKEQIGLTVASEMHIGQITNALMSLFRLRIEDEAFIEELRKLLIDINRLKEKRDTITHSHWYATKVVNPGQIYRFKTSAKFKKGLQVTAEEHSPKEINEISDGLEKCGHRLDDIWERSGIPKAK